MQTLEQRLESLATEAATLNPNNSDDRFRLTVIQQQQAEIEQQIRDSDRLHRQADEIRETPLPHDYDAKWIVVGANDEIRNLLQQVKEYLFSQHNEELAQLQDAHNEHVRKVEESKAELVDRVASLEIALANADGRALRAESDRRAAEVDKQTAEEERTEAESKRDNAVVAKEEAEAERDKALSQVKSLNSQIDELEGMLRTYRSRSNNGAVSGLVLTSTLKTESDDERKARIERERIEQINRGLARIGSDPLPLPPSPAPAQVEAAAASEEPDERFPADEDAHDSCGLADEDESLEVAGEEITLEGLAERVKALEAFKTAFEIGFFDK